MMSNRLNRRDSGRGASMGDELDLTMWQGDEGAKQELSPPPQVREGPQSLGGIPTTWRMHLLFRSRCVG